MERTRGQFFASVWLALPLLLASTNASAAATPSNVPADWWATAAPRLADSEYEITWQEQTSLRDLPSSWQAPNRAHDFRTYFTSDGIRVIPRSAAPTWELGLRLARWRRAGSTAVELVPGIVRTDKNGLLYDRGTLVESYLNDRRGLKQSFTIARAPDANEAGTRADGLVQLDIAVGGTLSPRVAANGQAIDFATPQGVNVVHYAELRVVDAQGRTLTSWMEGFSEPGVRGIRIVYDDTGAVYPVTVDPLATSAAWTAESDQPGAHFGVSVATAGDVNGDGYSDVIVGASSYDNGESNEGRAFVYLGSAGGLAAAPAWTAEIDQADALFGSVVATAGDVNGDGYADVIVGAPNVGAFVYHGSLSGLAAAVAWSAVGNQVGAGFGISVATAGDVNGDGYSDVIIGANLYDNGQADEGRAAVYHGSPSGLAAFPAWTAESNQANANFGRSVSTAGDVNGDGYSDVIVGADLFDNGSSNEGRAYVFHGSSTGLAAAASRTVESNQVSAEFGFSVATAGDVNGDGYSDVIVGAHQFDNGQTGEGRAFVYLGSSTGTAAAAAWTAESNLASALFGYSVATAGDVNGDGYADVIVGSTWFASGEAQEGRAFVYLGSSAGLAATAAWTAESDQVGATMGSSVATAGDVDGDGYSDVIVGSEAFSNGEGLEGRAYVFRGSAAGLAAAAAWTTESNQASAYFGYSVTTAGDVNGDGYSDVIVSAAQFDNGQTNEGRAYVYLGSATGLATTAAWTAEGNQASAWFGRSVASAGDVNGDGYSDVIVGAYEFDNVEVDEGRVFVYLGSAAGLATSAAWTAESNQTGGHFGNAVATAGDVNGDGYSDVIVGAYSYANSLDRGWTFVYHGSAVGLASTPDWTAEGDQADAIFGSSVSTAGDVNGDGYSDVIVGAPMYDSGESDEGRTFVYLGSALGLATTPAWTEEIDQAGAGFGDSVSTAGDVNGDGYSDVIVGATGFDDGLSNEGGAFVYLGSASGPAATAAWTAEGEQVSAFFGSSVAMAGDVNGDGYSDVIVGALSFDNGLTDEGRAAVYHGSGMGLATSAAWTAEGNQASAFFGNTVGFAGDVNGDGYADVIVGALHYDNGSTDEGRAFVFYGNDGDGLNRIPRQARSNDSAPISLLGRSESNTSFRLKALGRTPAGRGRVRLESEVKPQGVAFDGSGVVRGEAQLTSAPSASGSSVALSETITGLDPNRYHWRLRILTDSPFFPRSRWMSLPFNGVAETDLRTAGCIDRDGDGYGNPGDDACVGESTPDCDDTNASVHPNAIEICNAIDENCDGSLTDANANASCNDANPCTDDSCSVGGSCVHANNAVACNDGDACTTADTCAAGVCVGGAPLVCSDANACTDDFCNPASGCVYAANAASCNDGDACTANDVCWKGACIGSPACLGIRFQPTPQATILGGRAIFTVIASGQAPISYQWRKNGVDLVDGSRISGATSDVLILTRAQSGDAGAYSVVVTDTSGSVTSVDAALSVMTPQGGDVDHSFDPGSAIDLIVRAFALQSDGRVLIGGYFTTVDGATRGRVARLNADGTTDKTFGNGLAGADSFVESLAVQPDGRVLIGGGFTTVNGVSRKCIARLNADGSLDTTFLNGLAGTNSAVSSLAVLPDGRVLIGGYFTAVNGVSRSRVARLNADGSLDTTFLSGLSGADNFVFSLAVQPDGRVLIGGPFTSVNGVSRSYIARLNADGSLDTTFLNGLAGANGFVHSLVPQPDGRVLISGAFTTVNGVSRNYIARLNADGSLDGTFLNGLTGGSNGIYSLAVQPDGRVLIGGAFTTFNGVSRSRVARLNADGSLDATFLNGLAGMNNVVYAFAVQPSGRMLIGGDFTTVNGVSRSRVARLNADGSLDATFLNGLAGVNDDVYSLAVQPDGRVLIDGYFTAVNGVSRNFIARLDADGSLDATFLNGLTGTNYSLYSLAAQPDGRVLIGGGFTTVNGVSRNNIARLNADGSLDATFLNGLAGTNGNVTSLAVQPDGRVLIGGGFTTVNGVSRNYIARLNADGSLDASFLNGLAGVDSYIDSLAVQPDGRVLIGGPFSSVNGVSRNYIARLNADGSLDVTFLNGLAGTNSSVSALAVQPDGRVLIGGNFTTVNGVSRNYIARLNADGSLDVTFLNGLAGANSSVSALAVQPDGRVLIGGAFTTVNGVSRSHIVRLDADGSLDAAFLNGLGGASSYVYSLAVQQDGRVLIGGDFTTVNGVSRNHVARLYGSTPVAPTISVQPSAQVSYDGQCAVFHVTATGTPRDYRWRKNGVDLVDGGAISGATSDTLTITGVAAADVGNYSVVVSNVLASDTSADAALTIASVPQCKAATCDPVLGSVLVDALNGTSCNDSDVCTTSDTCSAGACVGGAPMVCTDSNPCTDNSCNPATGCVFPNNTAPCSDGNACTTGDSCAVGSCISGPPLVCDDSNTCTDNSCNPASGCVFTANAASCDDGNACTTNDVCWKSTCSGAPACLGIQFQPTAQATILGGQARFTVIASGQAPLSYQWRKGGGDLSDGGAIAGSTTNVLTLTHVTAAEAGDYSVVVTDTTGSVTSAVAALSVTTPQGGDVDFSFDPGASINASVRAVALQSDGKVLVAGDFTSASGAARGGVARLNPDGSTDYTFGNGLAGANDSVNLGIYSLAVQPDGRVLIGGNFATVNGVNRKYLARLNADGSLDTTFLNGLAGPSSVVYSLAVQPDGRVLIAGGFSSVNGVSRNYIARLNADGSLDTTFLNGLVGANSIVLSLAVQPDGRVLIGGFFTTVNGVVRNYVARLNADGSLDTTFLNGLAGASDYVYSVAVQPDGRLLLGGHFDSINGVNRYHVARVNADGSLDTAFLDGLAGVSGGVVGCLTVQPDGRVLIGGDFSTVNGVNRNNVARLNADGSLDTTFLNGLAGANSQVRSLVVQPNGRVLMGGSYTSVHGSRRNRVARLNADGSLDTAFLNGVAGVDSDVFSLAVQRDGRVLIGGQFGAVNGVSRNRIGRLNADGSLDPTFLNGLDGASGTSYTIALQPDGRVLVGGVFNSINGASRNCIARLNSDGSVDTSFMNGLTGANSDVRSLALQSDGRVLIGGYFTTVNGVSRNYIARLNADGALDTTFLSAAAGANFYVRSLVLQPDGRVLIGGDFTMVNGVSRNRIARLNADGSLDTTFLNGLAGANGGVTSFAVQADGRVLIGGGFSMVNGVSRSHIARLNADGSLDATFLNGLGGAADGVNSLAVQTDGRVLIGGYFTTVNGMTRHYATRLNADGSLDSTFMNGLGGVNNPVFAFAVQLDGRIIVGGAFGGVNGVPRSSVARLYGSTPIAPVITVDPAAQVSHAGSCAVFHVTATGTPRDYRWRKNGVDLVDGGAISGAASDTLTITGVGAADVGDYGVVVSNVLGSDTSTEVALTTASVPQCKVATCDPVLGSVLVDAPNGTACNDGNACTSGDSCAAGVCVGACSCLTAADADADGYGNPAAVVMRCDATVPPGYVTNSTDCNDSYASIHPGATEDCNLIDDDCDVTVDEGLTQYPWYGDADGDFYGNPAVTVQACLRPPGYAGNALDCDDTRSTVRPGGLESCDGRRNDCNDSNWPAILDDDADLIENACEACVDGDGDGWGDPGAPGNLCAADNCTLVANADQLNSDGDGRGNACDPCPLDGLDDQDGDGLCGDVDDCPTIANVGQADTDGDGFGDVCDLCPSVSTHLNNDNDGDGIGNACDPDVDGDGIANGVDPNDDNDRVPDDDGDGVFDPCPNLVNTDCDDNCPFEVNPFQRDRDGDFIGDSCDTADGVVQGGRASGSPGGSFFAGGSTVYTFGWGPEDGATAYNVYSGTLTELRAGSYGGCFRRGLVTTYTGLDSVVPAGTGRFYLVAPVYPDHVGSLGDRSDQTERPLPSSCP